jgi:translation initiation factor IF-1
MASSDNIELEGKVIDVLPSGKFLVEVLDMTDQKVLAHLSGKMRQNKIKIVLGDLVTLEVSPYDATRGRITRRRN